MPKLGLTMESGTIVAWLVDDGAEVAAGTPVLAIETDKTETDVEAAASGRLHQLGVAGDSYDCGAVIGWLLADGEALPDAPVIGRGSDAVVAAADATEVVAATRSTIPDDAPGDRLFASPNARRLAGERGIDLRHVRGTGPGGRIVAADLETVSIPSAAATDGRRADGPTATSRLSMPATVAARNLADLLGVDLADVAPDPVDQRITREGVARYVRGRLAGAATAISQPARAASPPVVLLQQPSAVIPFRGIRGTIARRMSQSLNDMAQLSLFMDADLSAVRAHRAGRVADAPAYTDYVVAAVARALVAHPIFNAQVTDDGVALLPAVHVGIAVGVDGGVVVPVVRDAASNPLTAIAAESRRLIEAARAGRIELRDLEGGTCSVTSLGMFGVDGFTPIINPPNVAIVGVGRLRDQLEFADDGIVASRPVMTLSLTWDHRVADGVPAAEFCRTIVDLLSRPAELDAEPT